MIVTETGCCHSPLQPVSDSSQFVKQSLSLGQSLCIVQERQWTKIGLIHVLRDEHRIKSISQKTSKETRKNVIIGRDLISRSVQSHCRRQTAVYIAVATIIVHDRTMIGKDVRNQSHNYCPKGVAHYWFVRVESDLTMGRRDL